MKQWCFPIILLFFTIISVANTPEKISYQAVIRNADGELVKNSKIGVQISILQGIASEIVVYCETQNSSTNANGLVTLAIGEGKVVSGILDNIDWSDGPYFIKTETDIKGGSNYTISGVSQLMSVPFAFHSNTAESLTKPVEETDPVFEESIASGITSNDTANWNRKLGSYTETDPVYEKSTARGITQTDTVNWNRKLSSETDPKFSAWDKSSGVKITESQITDLNHFTNNDETDPVFGNSIAKGISKTDTSLWNSKSNFSGNYIDLSGRPTNVSSFTNDAGYQRVADDGDTDPMNELQSIYRSGDKIGINNGGWVSIKDAESDPVFSAWDKSSGITIIESQISNLKHFTNTDEKDPKYASDSSYIKSGTRSWNSSLAKNIDASDTTRWGAIETDPVFSTWDKSSGISITESQISNLKHFTNIDEIDPRYTADSSYIKSGTRSWNSSLAKNIDASDTTRWGAIETDPVFSTWDKSSGISITESQISNLKHFTNIDEIDPRYTADSSYIKSGTRSWNSSLAKNIDASDTTRWGATETDPVFSTWDKSSGISITESQISNLKHFTNTDEIDPRYAADSSYIKSGTRSWNSSLAKNIDASDTIRWGATETDPVFSTWDKSSGISITESQISNLKHFTNTDEKDPKYASDSSYIKSGTRSWNSSLAKNIDAIDTTRWGATETDPVFSTWDKSSGISITESQISNLKHFTNADEEDPKYASDSAFIKSSVQNWNSSLAKNITATDTANWNSKTSYISDFDGDTKIETEQTTDEDVIRMKVAGNERMSLNNSTGTVLQLPTSDDNSSMKVKNSNGDVVFGVDGRGLMNGDGSGLSNLKPLIAFAGGNSNVIITSYNPYIPTLVQYVEIVVPGPGVILTQATGYIQWKSTSDDYCRISVISDDIATNTSAFGNNYYSYLMLSGDHNLADSIDEYNNFSYSRVFTVSTAGTYRYNLWSDKGYAHCYIQIADANMQAIYFPTGGTGALTLKSASVSSSEAKNLDNEYDPTLPRNLDGSVITKNSNDKKPGATRSLSKSKEMMLEKKLAQQQEEIDSLKSTLNQLIKRVELKSK